MHIPATFHRCPWKIKNNRIINEKSSKVNYMSLQLEELVLTVERLQQMGNCGLETGVFNTPLTNCGHCATSSGHFRILHVRSAQSLVWCFTLQSHFHDIIYFSSKARV